MDNEPSQDQLQAQKEARWQELQEFGTLHDWEGGQNILQCLLQEKGTSSGRGQGGCDTGTRQGPESLGRPLGFLIKSPKFSGQEIEPTRPGLGFRGV